MSVEVPTGERGPAALVQSVDRALEILEFLAGRGEAGVTEIAAELGVHKSTAFRLVAVLEGRGFVEQLADRGKYRLGFGIVRLAGAAVAQLDLAQEGRRVCEELAADVGETVNVAILDSGRAVNVTQVRGSATISTHNWVGHGTPLHATSSGKVLLAYAAVPVRKEVLSDPLERFTEATVTDPDVLERQLSEIAVRGWGATVEELEIGLNAVAAPVRDPDGQVIAAVSVSGPSFRLSPESLDGLGSRVVAAADELSRRLGYFG
ncbi:DNA-binding IclR family transcriptional regulator [Geodermatophilus bullaregiensis]|uniref:IclR family transcriptional regulator n=1 Tax=Geodermatophilus bullaregiensis TaxID=1564160 RepID=UPI00195A2500|nr:IclR family transcriptional regulator [Geodermatophilus bullaregiensis]MBM7805193.1 DNA-binding IclR family transcriptional regulator [Geodermatophilus bullaregiensis]